MTRASILAAAILALSACAGAPSKAEATAEASPPDAAGDVADASPDAVDDASDARRSVAYTIRRTDAGFDPAFLRVHAGDVVTFASTGSRPTHIVSGFECMPDGLFDTGTLAPGDTYRVVLTWAGPFPYLDALDCSVAGAIAVDR